MDIQTVLITAIKSLIRGFSDINRIRSNIQIFGQCYRIRIGPDYTTKILDRIRIAKISDPINIRQAE